MSRKNYYFERRLLRSARNDSVLKWLVGLVGVDFRQSRKSTPNILLNSLNQFIASRAKQSPFKIIISPGTNDL